MWYDYIEINPRNDMIWYNSIANKLLIVINMLMIDIELT